MTSSEKQLEDTERQQTGLKQNKENTDIPMLYLGPLAALLFPSGNLSTYTMWTFETLLLCPLISGEEHVIYCYTMYVLYDTSLPPFIGNQHRHGEDS